MNWGFFGQTGIWHVNHELFIAKLHVNGLDFNSLNLIDSDLNRNGNKKCKLTVPSVFIFAIGFTSLMPGKTENHAVDAALYTWA